MDPMEKPPHHLARALRRLARTDPAARRALAAYRAAKATGMGAKCAARKARHVTPPR